MLAGGARRRGRRHARLPADGRPQHRADAARPAGRGPPRSAAARLRRADRGRGRAGRADGRAGRPAGRAAAGRRATPSSSPTAATATASAGPRRPGRRRCPGPGRRRWPRPRCGPTRSSGSSGRRWPSGAVVVVDRFLDEPAGAVRGGGRPGAAPSWTRASWTASPSGPPAGCARTCRCCSTGPRPRPRRPRPGLPGEEHMRVQRLLTRMAAAEPHRYVVVDADGCAGRGGRAGLRRAAPGAAAAPGGPAADRPG